MLCTFGSVIIIPSTYLLINPPPPKWKSKFLISDLFAYMVTSYSGFSLTRSADISNLLPLILPTLIDFEKNSTPIPIPCLFFSSPYQYNTKENVSKPTERKKFGGKEQWWNLKTKKKNGVCASGLNCNERDCFSVSLLIITGMLLQLMNWMQTN